MPLKLSDLTSDLREIPVTMGAFTLTVKYTPYFLTMADEARLRDADQTVAGVIVDSLCNMVSSWDLVDADGTPIPITREALLEQRVPLRLMRDVVDAVYADLTPGKVSTNTSSPGSESDPAPAPPQTGTS